MKLLLAFPALFDRFSIPPRPSTPDRPSRHSLALLRQRDPTTGPSIHQTLRQAVLSLRVLRSECLCVPPLKASRPKTKTHDKSRHRNRPLSSQSLEQRHETENARSLVCRLLTVGTQGEKDQSSNVGTQFFPGPTEALCHSPQHAPYPLFQAPITAQFCQLEPPGPSGNNRLAFATLTKSHRGSTIHGLQRAR